VTQPFHAVAFRVIEGVKNSCESAPLIGFQDTRRLLCLMGYRASILKKADPSSPRKIHAPPPAIDLPAFRAEKQFRGPPDPLRSRPERSWLGRRSYYQGAPPTPELDRFLLARTPLLQIFPSRCQIVPSWTQSFLPSCNGSHGLIFFPPDPLFINTGLSFLRALSTRESFPFLFLEKFESLALSPQKKPVLVLVFSRRGQRNGWFAVSILRYWSL